jgi:hypothetical protein
MKEWQSYDTWIKQRNKKRFETETRAGYDTKHASHLIRLLRMGHEIISTGKVNVDRSEIDAEELLAVKRHGVWSFEKLVEYAEKMQDELDKLYVENPCGLPKKPNIKKIEKVFLTMLDEFYRSL